MHNINESLKKQGLLNKNWKMHKTCAAFCQRHSPELWWCIQCIKISGIRQFHWKWFPSNYCNCFVISYSFSLSTIPGCKTFCLSFLLWRWKKSVSKVHCPMHFVILGLINSCSSSFSLFLKRNGIWIRRETRGRLTLSSDVCSAQRQLVPHLVSSNSSSGISPPILSHECIILMRTKTWHIFYSIMNTLLHKVNIDSLCPLYLPLC